MPGQQRGRLLDTGAHAPLDDKSAEDERPEAHRRTRAPPSGTSDRSRLEFLPGLRSQGGRDGERELGARAEANMRRDRLEHADPRAARKP